ncbi:MAG: DNA primase, partial [Oscillospiraceae bacterium]
PFHNEKTPSFSVYPETNSFYCFGCGAAGSAIDFVKRIQNLDFVEAVKFLAARSGMPLPDEDDEASKQRGRVLLINRETARYYAECLNSEAGKAARAYLRGRALSDATIRRFGLGYAPDEFGALMAHLKAMGFTEQELLLAGVCKRSAKGSVYDAFRARVIFPIIDLRGNVIAFGGRIMQKEGGPKYLNSGDTPVFKKSRGLFALNIAQKNNSKRFILAEGYMDVISLHQAGLGTAVATLGTALTPEQAKLISDYAEEVVICYDADEAGQKATARAIGILKNTQLKVGVLTVPDAKDPDEFIKKFGAEKFEQLLGGSRNTIEYALQKAKAGLDLATEDGRAAYVRAALAILAKEAAPAEQDIYAGRIAEETDVAKSAVLNQLEGVVRQRKYQLAKEREKRQRSEGMAAGVDIPYAARGEKALSVAFAEQQLVAALVKNPADFLPLVEGQVAAKNFLSPNMAQVYRAITETIRQAQYVDMAVLSDTLPEEAMGMLGKILAKNYDTVFSAADVKMFMQRILQEQMPPSKAGGLPAEDFRSFMAAKAEEAKDKKQQ